jgi:dTDP-4-amino-4,6-dideoxygalactose transaminase
MTQTERAADEVVSLPMHTELTEAEIEYICESVHEYVTTEQEAGA